MQVMQIGSYQGMILLRTILMVYLQEAEVGQRFHLNVGGAAELDKGLPIWVGFPWKKFSVVYAGMPGESIYSLAVTFSTGYNSMAYNLYFPLTQTRIELGKGYLEAVEATPEYMTFNYVSG